MLSAINIVSFDVPYPANYGGVIDVYYKIKALFECGVKIHLHCFEYGRGEQKKLEEFCEKIYYYKRNTSIINHFSVLPYIVKSRQSALLLQNLLKNDFPILFEGLHTCSLMQDPQLKNRYKIFRESNIEHEYYLHLAGAEKNAWKRLYFQREAKKLQNFEAIVADASLILTVSKEDNIYFQKKYPATRVEYLPSFHPNNQVNSHIGKGDYILYHGNLSVAENSLALEFLIQNVFSKITYPVIVAGLNPAPALKNLINQYQNTRLIENPDELEMEKLISNAQLHCLYTHQATGLKLKLLNVLYSGRFCVCNSKMVHGTGLDDLCLLADTPEQIIETIHTYFTMGFSNDTIHQRIKVLGENYNNGLKAKKLIELIGERLSV